MQMTYKQITITRGPVNSSNVHSIGYDETSKTLEVQFWKCRTPGKIYRYFPVTLEAYQELMKADSIGAHLNKHIIKNPNVTFIEIK